MRTSISSVCLALPFMLAATNAQAQPDVAPPADAQGGSAPAAAPAAAAPETATPAPAPAEPAGTMAPAPEPSAPPAEPAPVSPPEAGPGEAAPAEAPAASEEEGGIPGWFRIDSDGLALQLWVGATHSVGPVDIATDIYVDSGTFGEFDIGPSFSFGPLALTPMAGIGFDWSQQKAVSLIAPQLFTILDLDPIYFESWIQVFLNSPFADGADNDFYTRDFLLLKATEDLHIGPQIEATIALNNKDARDKVGSLPIGGRINLAYGANNTLGLFLGYETQKNARTVDTGELDANDVPIVADDRALVGRFTFVRTW